MVKNAKPVSLLEQLKLSGRWISSPSGSLSASWTGSSVSFTFIGRFLSVVSGPNTERKDRSSTTPILAISVGPDEASVVGHSSFTKVFDIKPGKIINLVDKQEGQPMEKFVRIMLIDWATTFEFDSLITDEKSSISLPPITSLGRILYIGDSISCGLNDIQPTRGCLDAFPYVSQRLLAQETPLRLIDVDLISYPGWTLVSPTEDEKERGHPLGMQDKFFHISPWSTDLYEGFWGDITTIVIELGTNDQEYYSMERFTTSLHNLLSRLLEIMPPPRFVWLIPPFPEDDEDSPLRDEFKNIIPNLQAEFRNRTIIQLCDTTSDVDTIDGLHPSLVGQEALGSRMAEIIKPHF